MANDIFNYCVATNTGKGFITHTDSRKFWIRGYPANVWVCADMMESRLWVARNNGVSKTKDQAQALVTTEIEAAQAAWDDLSDEEKAATSGRPTTITLP
jgi:hypothetical protein